MKRFWPAAVLILQLFCSRALAEPGGYRAAIDEAISEFAAHRFGEARELFARAHAIYPNARTLRGLGLAEFELRDYVSCVRHLDQALRSPERPLDEDLRHETEKLRERANGFVARLTLASRPNPSRLLVDGSQSEWTAQPLLLSFGAHTLELYASGYEPTKISLFLSGGEQRTINVELKQPYAAERRDVKESSWYASPWLWVAVGTVVIAGAATGVVLASNPRTAEQPFGGTSGVVIPGI
jgi:tetratricopeptide (TPR) repeat protein